MKLNKKAIITLLAALSLSTFAANPIDTNVKADSNDQSEQANTELTWNYPFKNKILKGFVLCIIHKLLATLIMLAH